MKSVKLTPAEWEIMEAVWELGGSPSVRNVLDRAFANGEKAYTTVQTVMNTLERKRLLKRSKKGLVIVMIVMHGHSAARTERQK